MPQIYFSDYMHNYSYPTDTSNHKSTEYT